jgi:hypothetical protein
MEEQTGEYLEIPTGGERDGDGKPTLRLAENATAKWMERWVGR